MKKLFAAFIFLFPLQVFGSGLQSSFSGSNLYGLTRPTTIVEYDGSVNPTNDYLTDLTGRGHHLAPTHSPVSAASTLQKENGSKWIARTFDGANDFYSVAHHSDFNVFDQDFTFTVVLKSPASAPGATQVVFSHGAFGAAGFYLAMNSSGYYNYILSNSALAPTTKQSYLGTNTADGNYHVVQCVRSNDFAQIYVDGVAGTGIDVAGGYGVDGSYVLYYGVGNGGGSGWWASDILYARLDAEALSFDRLNYERNQIMGFGPHSGTADIGYYFSRTTTASQTNSDGTIDYVAANVPRTGGSGGGVLTEDQRANEFLRSQEFDNAAWTSAPNPVGVTPDNAIAPDGTVTADLFSEGLVGSGDSAHGLLQAPVIAAAAVYTISTYIKLVPGGRSWVFLRNATANKNAWFNLESGLPGTFSGNASGIIPVADGWYRIWMNCTSSTVGDSWWIRSAEADNDLQYTGDGRNTFWVWGAQVELGSYPSSYIETTSTSVTRAPDYLAIRTYRIGKNLQLGGERMWLDFSQDPKGSTITTNDGGYTLTKGGTIVQRSEYNNANYYHVFNGSDSRHYLAAGSDFNPNDQPFTVVVAFTPLSVTGSQGIVTKWGGAGNRGWVIQGSGTSATMVVSNDGTTYSTATVSSCLKIGKPHLLTGTYDLVNGTKLYVDSFPTGTAATVGAVYQSSDSFRIGSSSGSNYFNGNIHYVAYYHGYAASEAEHDYNYTRFKQPNILPRKIGNSYQAKKLYIQFDSKCPYTSLGDVPTGQSIAMLEISGNIGSADSDTNRLRIYSNNTGVYLAVYPDGENTQRFMSTTVTTRNLWHTYKFYLDFSELSNSTGYVDSSLFGNNASLTDPNNFDFSDTEIRINQDYTGSVNNSCVIKNLRLWTTE